MQTAGEFGSTGVRRTLDVEDYLNILRRQKGWLLGPLLAATVASCVIAFLRSDTYVSVASIRVVPPQVPEKFVPTNVSNRMSDRVNSMAQTILSRNTLTNIIHTYDLYGKDRAGLPMEDVIENMSKDIRIGQLRLLANTAAGAASGAQAFQISFQYHNRYVAQKVCRDLMSRFIDENIRQRSSQSQLTTQFLKEQLDQAKSELDGIEVKMTQFRMQNAGRLPEQLMSNVHSVNTLETRISVLNSSLARANQEKLMLDGELRQVREQIGRILKTPAAAAGGTARPVAAPDENLVRIEREIGQLEQLIERMLETYKPTYPDVQRLETRLIAARKERERLLRKQMVLPDAAVSGSTPLPPMDAARIKELAELETTANRLQNLIRTKELEAETFIRQIADADRRMQEIQGRIESGPIGEQQFQMLMRDRELAKQRYDDLNRKVAESEIATDLESRKQGETLEVLDLPSLPESPSAPNRPLIIVMGSVIGLVIGTAILGLREMRDTSLKTLKDISALTGMNILGTVPLLENDFVVRRRRHMAWLGWSGALLLSVVVVSGSIYHYYATRL